MYDETRVTIHEYLRAKRPCIHAFFHTSMHAYMTYAKSHTQSTVRHVHVPMTLMNPIARIGPVDVRVECFLWVRRGIKMLLTSLSRLSCAKMGSSGVSSWVRGSRGEFSLEGPGSQISL